MYRYLFAIWDPSNLEGVRTSQRIIDALAAGSSGWTRAYERPGALVVNSGTRRGSSQIHRLSGTAGVVLGCLFDRRRDDYSTRPEVTFDQAETRTLITSGGQHLVEQYWGSYVAVLFDEASHIYHVLRDPTSNMPCYHARKDGVDVFFSHVQDCVRFLHVSFAPSSYHLTRWLINGRQAERTTCLDGVEEIPGGERISLHRGERKRAFLWRPVEIAASPAFENPDDAAKALRTTTQRTIDAWASCHTSIVHKLSGGLDSSIVAACLANAPSRPHLRFLNFSIDAAVDEERLYLPGVDKQTASKIRAISAPGDERHFARLVADRWQVELIERQRNVSMDLTRMREVAASTSPAMYFAVMELEDAEIELARLHGVEAFFSGQAGDSVLLATMQPLPAVDYARIHGLTPALWRHVAATSLLSRESVWSVLGKAIKYGALRRRYHPPAPVLQQPTLLKEEIVRSLSLADFDGVWSKLSESLPPGKQNHVEGLVGSVFYDCVYRSGEQSDHIDPLNSQPIWELMLRIPTYTILTGGVSRGLARRAFSDLLPREIRSRQSKGSGSAFYQHVVRRNRELLRERLIDGVLAREGYLDRDKVESYLAADEPFVTVNAAQVLSYLAAEHWLEQWSDINRNTLAQSPSLQSRAG